ncbi:hypothetical protein Tco_0268609 [Tanacetum coccineum]
MGTGPGSQENHGECFLLRIGLIGRECLNKPNVSTFPEGHTYRFRGRRGRHVDWEVFREALVEQFPAKDTVKILIPNVWLCGELAQRLHEEELAELDRAQKERQKQEEATKFFERRKETIGPAEEHERSGYKEQTKLQELKVRNKRITYLNYYGTKKRPRADSEEESSKKQKLEEDNDAEKEELRDSMDVVPRDDVAIDVESLATKYPIID